MSFYEPKDLRIGDLYKLTEFAEGIKVSSGNCTLVSMDQSPRDLYPILGFVKGDARRKAEVFLRQAHHGFGGDPTWRRAFRVDNHWEVYWPVGGATWLLSWVEVEKAS